MEYLVKFSSFEAYVKFVALAEAKARDLGFVLDVSSNHPEAVGVGGVSHSPPRQPPKACADVGVSCG